MGSFMTLLCRSVYNVQCHIYEGIHSLTEQGCSDSDRDVNAARNILSLALGHERPEVGIPVL